MEAACAVVSEEPKANLVRDFVGGCLLVSDGLPILAGPGSTNVSVEVVAANNGKPPCSSNKTYTIPQEWQNAALRNHGWTISSISLSANGDITGLQITNLRPLNFQGLQLSGNSRMTLQTAPGGFTLDVSGSPGYLGLPTGDTVTTLKGTTEVASWTEKALSKGLDAVEDFALPAGAAATLTDLAAHQTCMASQFPDAAGAKTVAF